MIYLATNSNTPITVVEGLGNHFIAARISPNGSAHRIKSKRLEPELKCLDAFIALHKYAEIYNLTAIDEEISVAGVEYRLQADPHDAAHGIGYIKALAQARSSTSTASGKAQKGMFSWQKHSAFDMSNGWRSVVLEWTRLFLLAREEQIARRKTSGKVETRPNDSAPGTQISAETVEGEVLPPTADTAVAKRGRGRPVNTSYEIGDDSDWDDSGDFIPTSSTPGKASGLSDIARQIKVEVEEFRKLENQAAWRALRIGVMVLKARQGLEHGQFIPWLKAHVPLSRIQVWKYTRAAEYLLERGKVALDAAYDSLSPNNLLAGSDAAKRKLLPKPVQMVFDFVGDRSFEDICVELGISGHQKKRSGGDHGGGKARAEQLRNRTDDDMRILLGGIWDDLVGQLREFVIAKRQYVHLKPEHIKVGMESLKDCMRLLAQDLNLK